LVCSFLQNIGCYAKINKYRAVLLATVKRVTLNTSGETFDV